MGAAINNESTTTERTAALARMGVGGLNAFYWYQTFILDSAVVKA